MRNSRCEKKMKRKETGKEKEGGRGEEKEEKEEE